MGKKWFTRLQVLAVCVSAAYPITGFSQLSRYWTALLIGKFYMTPQGHSQMTARVTDTPEAQKQLTYEKFEETYTLRIYPAKPHPAGPDGYCEFTAPASFHTQNEGYQYTLTGPFVGDKRNENLSTCSEYAKFPNMLTFFLKQGLTHRGLIRIWPSDSPLGLVTEEGLTHYPHP